MMTRIIKILAVFALIAGYAYVSDQDYQDEQLAEQVYKAYHQ